MTSFDHAIDEYQRYLWQNGYKKNSIKNYLKAIRQTLKNTELENITQRTLDDISIELRKHYQPNGNRIRHAAINLFCKVVLKRNDLHLKIPRSMSRNRDVLTNEEVDKILEAASEESRAVYGVIQTVYDCALRINEVCNLNLEDIDFQSMEISLRDTKTGDNIVTMTTRVAEAINDYLVYERCPADKKEKALFISEHGLRIGEHFVRNHLKRCAVEAGIHKRVYTHMLRASCITHLFNEGINPSSIQRHARHRDFAQTMTYNRPTQQQMKADIEKVFAKKPDLNDEDRMKVVFDKYARGEITGTELQALLEMIRPKQLKHRGEFSGYA
jgi:site-specific recombinase XerD